MRTVYISPFAGYVFDRGTVVGPELGDRQSADASPIGQPTRPASFFAANVVYVIAKKRS